MSISFHRSVRSPVHAHYGLIVSGADRFHRAGLLLLIPEPALNLIIVKQTVSSQQNPELLRARWWLRKTTIPITPRWKRFGRPGQPASCPAGPTSLITDGPSETGLSVTNAAQTLQTQEVQFESDLDVLHRPYVPPPCQDSLLLNRCVCFTHTRDVCGE